MASEGRETTCDLGPEEWCGSFIGRRACKRHGGWTDGGELCNRAGGEPTPCPVCQPVGHLRRDPDGHLSCSSCLWNSEEDSGRVPTPGEATWCAQHGAWMEQCLAYGKTHVIPNESGRETTPEPFPVGHGLDLDRASAVCLCGVLIHECIEMLRWGFRRQEQLRQEAPDA